MNRYYAVYNVNPILRLRLEAKDQVIQCQSNMLLVAARPKHIDILKIKC